MNYDNKHLILLLGMINEKLDEIVSILKSINKD